MSNVSYGTCDASCKPDRTPEAEPVCKSNSDGNAKASGKTGCFATAVLLVNDILGAGMVNLAQAYGLAGGVVVGISVQIVLMLFIFPTLLVLAYASDISGAVTLQEVMFSTWGKPARTVTSACIAFNTFVTSTAFFIIVGDQFDRFFASLLGPTFCDRWYLDRHFTLSAVAVTFILPFCFSRRIDFLKHISGLGMLAVTYVVLCITVHYWYGGYVAGPINTWPQSWTNLFLVVPSLCVSYQCHFPAVPIYQCMKDRSVKKFAASTALAMFICSVFYGTAGSLGYMTFGSYVKSDILESYDAHDVSVIIAILAMAINCSTSYPVMAYCGREAILSLVAVVAEGRFSANFQRITISSLWFLSSLSLAIITPNVRPVIQVIGSTAILFIFIVPGICLLRMWHLRQNPWFLCGATVYLVFGAAIFGIVLTQSLTFLLDPTKNIEPSLCIS